jgi:conjugal transfer ATP-binding protein TraC
MTATLPRNNFFSKTKIEGLSGLLPYWHMTDGISFLEDGRCEVGAEVFFPPTTFMTNGGLEYLCRCIKGALRSGVKGGERMRLMIEVGPAKDNKVSEYETLIEGQNQIASSMSQARATMMRELINQEDQILEWRAWITVTAGSQRLGNNTPNVPMLVLSKLIPALATRTHVPFSESEYAERFETATNQRDRLMSFLENGGLSPRAMTTQDMFELTCRYFNPGMRNVKWPDYKTTWQVYPKDQLEQHPNLNPPTLRSQIAKTGFNNASLSELEIGWKKIRILSLTTAPDETIFGMMNPLLSSGNHMWLVIDFEHEEQDKAISRLKGQARQFYSMAANSDSYVDPNVRVGLGETEAAIEHIAATGDHVFRVGCNIIIVGDDSKTLERQINSAFSAAANVPGNPFSPLTFGLLEPFIQSAPLSANMIDYRVSLFETSAAHFFPIGSPWKGAKKPVALFQNDWKAFTSINLFDPEFANYNFFIGGGSGQGKTFFAQFLLTEHFRDGNTDLIIVDKGAGFSETVNVLNGARVDLQPGSKSRINPFDLPDERLQEHQDNEEGRLGKLGPDNNHMALLVSSLQAMSRDAAPEAAPSAKQVIIESAVTAMYQAATDEYALEGGGYIKVIDPTRCYMSNFVETLGRLSKVGSKATDEADIELAKAIQTSMQMWTGKTLLGSFVDGPTEIPISDNSVLMFETNELYNVEQLPGVAILLMAWLIWKIVQKNKARKKIVIFDEAWKALQIPEIAAFLVELYRRIRRYNGAVGSISQELGDFNTGAGAGIISNTTSFFLLKMQDDQVRTVKEILKLPDGAIQSFMSLQRGEVLVWIDTQTGKQGGKIWVKPTQFDLWAFTTNANMMAKRDIAYNNFKGDKLKALQALSTGKE